MANFFLVNSDLKIKGRVDVENIQLAIEHFQSEINEDKTLDVYSEEDLKNEYDALHL